MVGDMGCLGGGEWGLWASAHAHLAGRPTRWSSASDEGSARASGYFTGLPARHRSSSALSGALPGIVIDDR